MKPIDISEQLMFSTVRLVAANGTCGTGYFFNFKCSKGIVPVIITNKHVVNNNPDESMTFLVHLTSNGETDDCNYSVNYVTRWVFHPKYDLCFTFVARLFESIKQETGKEVFYRALDQSLIYSDEQLKELSMLESVVMIGYPNGLWDQNHNYPIFRKGFTASHPGYDFNSECIGLVDIACFPGSSGSPILILDQGSYTSKNGNVSIGVNRVVFLGTLFAGPAYNADGTITIKDIPTVQTPVSQTQVMMNLGYYIKSSALDYFETYINNVIK